MRMEICLLRHGYSTKNEEDRHGGGGLLTPRGVKETRLACSRIKTSYSPLDQWVIWIYSSAFPHVLSSAEILSRDFGVRINIDSRIEPLNLGVLSGLTIDEAGTKFPGPASRMQEWREGKREISQLAIPGAEDLTQFWQRGTDFLSELAGDRRLNIVVGTRSIITLLVNIMLGNSIKMNGGFCPVEIPTGGIAAFKRESGEWRVSSTNLWDVKLVKMRKAI